MANLSNINGKFVVEQTTGYVGVGTTDPNFLIEAAGANSEIALNSTSASIYRLRSTSSDSFIITKNGVGDRLVIAGNGDATFAGNVILGDTPQIQLGTGNDAQIDHTGSHLFIDNSVGNSYLRNTSTGSIILRNSTGGDIQFDNEFAGNILFNTSNIERMRINSSGNIGIGTSSPTNLLTINDPNANSSITDTIPSWWGLVIDRAYSTSSTAAIGVIGGTVATGSSGRLYLGNSDDVDNSYIDGGANQLHFSVGGEKMRIYSSGNVTIGTVTSTAKLNIGGKLKITDDLIMAQTNGRIDYDNGVNTGALRFYSTSGNAERIRIASNGAIGIGGTNYGTAGQVLTSNGNAAPSWQAAGGSSAWTTSGNDIYNNNSGNVGIGITNPSFGLVVARNATSGTINDGVMIGMETTTNAGNAGYRFKSGGEYYQVLYNGSSIQWKNYDTTYNTKMILTNDGNLGVNNTDPSSHYSNYNQLVVGSGNGNQGITIFAGSNDESSINFTDTTTTFSSNFIIKVDHNDSSESNNPSFQINYENNRYVTINRQTTGSNQIPQVRLGMFNSSSLPANLDHSMLEIGINNGLNNPGMVMYGDSQGNSNPFVGMVSTSSSSSIATKFFRFYHNTTLCGTIQKRFNANEVQYLTTSDYRLKEDLKPFKALDTICKIKVYNYKWNNIKVDNVNYGVLAHELQELIPEVVAGEKDEVNKNGEEEYQSVDYSKLVPHLIQSIQELKADNDSLKARIETLENK